MVKISIVYGDDWVGLYIDGKLAYDNHQINAEDLLDVLKIDYESFSCDLEWLEERGCLPDDLDEVKKEE